MNAKPLRSRTGPTLAAFCLLIGLVIGSLWYIALVAYRTAVIEERGRELQAIAGSRSEYLRLWLEVRRSNATVPSRSPLIARAAEFGLDRDGPSGRAAVLERLTTIQTSYRYEAVMLFDREGRLLADVGHHDDAQPELGVAIARRAVAESRLVISRVRHADAGNTLHQDIDIAAPVIAASQNAPRIVGALVLHVDLREHLDTLMRKWPSASESGEAVLVERDDDRIVFLNTLRQAEAAQWRWNADDSRLPAAMAARGSRGVVESLDYRGVPVLAALDQVPGMPWYVVAKIDRAEILAPVRRQALWSGLLSGLLTLALWLALFAQWRRGRSELALAEEASAKRALAESEARYRALFESSPDAIFVHRDDILLFANRAAARLFAADSPKALCGRDWHELIAKEDWPVTEARVAAIVSGETLQLPPLERHHRTLDGRVVFTEAAASGISFDGEPAVLSSIHDITERKRAEEALRESENTLRTFLDNIPGAAFVMDTQGSVLYANRKAAESLGVPLEQLVGANVSSFLPTEVAASRIAWGRRAIEERKNLRFEDIRDGRDFETIICPVQDSLGEIHRAAVLGFDITERKQAERQRIEQARRQRDTLVREVHHRIKNHLQGLAGLLRQHMAQHDPLRPLLGEVIAQISAISIVHGLQGRTPDGRVSLRGLVSEIAAFLGGITGVPISLVGGAGRCFMAQASSREEICKWAVAEEESVPLALVINELLTNAIRHRQGEAPPSLDLECDSESSRLTIRNPGRLAEGLDFERGRGLGTGLGLVRALLPQQGIRLGLYGAEEGWVETTLAIAPPILQPMAETDA